VSVSHLPQECGHAQLAAVRYPEPPNLPQKDLTFCSSKPTRKSSPRAFGATLTAILLFGSSAWTQAANYYISASGPSGTGTGSSAANAADASSASKYDGIVNSHSASGTVIVYAAGTYLMTPSLPMYDNVTHQGAGIDKTIVKLQNGAASGSFNPMFLSQNGTNTGFHFFDATIDFNSLNQTSWSNNTCRSLGFNFTTADHCTIQRVKFINIGTKGGQESFPVFFVLGNSSNGNLNNNLVDSCIFSQPVVSGNSGGLTCVLMYDAYPGITVDSTNVVSNCQFAGLKSPTYSDLAYTQCATIPTFINNTITGVDGGWFIEPGTNGSFNTVYTGVTVLVSGNTSTNSGPIAYLLCHSNGSFPGNLNVQSNNVGMCQTPYQQVGLPNGGPNGVVIRDPVSGGTPTIGTVTVNGNTFTAPLPEGVSPCAVWANPTASNAYYCPSLTITNNNLINFPQDGNEFQVSSNTSYIGRYTHTGNTFGAIPAPTPSTGPYKGISATIPGTLYASNYNLGGQGVGYQDSVGANPGVYRTDGVDLKTTSDPTSGTGYVLGWRTTGEWTDYTVNVSAATSYAVSARVESAFNTGQGHVSVDGKTVIAKFTVPLTGPWDTASSWKTISLGSLALTAGKHLIQVYVDAAWFDLNYLTFTAPAPTPTPTPKPTPVPTSTVSKNDTIPTTVGPSIVDSALSVWKLTSNAQVSLNGQVVSYTANVVELSYVSGVVWQLNASGNWYSFTATGALGAGPTVTSPLPTGG
jgi:hypothetical protein